MVTTQLQLEPAHIPALSLPTFFLLFFFLGMPSVFFWAFLILFSEQYFYSNLRTMSLVQCFWAFNSIDYFVFTYLLSCIAVHDTF